MIISLWDNVLSWGFCL